MSVQFVPLTTFVDPSFFNAYNHKKLDDWKLDDTSKQAFATFTNYDSEHSSSRLSFSFDAFSETSGETHVPGVTRVEGTVLPLGIREDFQNLDRKSLISESADQLVGLIESGAWMKKPSMLNKFVLTIYGDLKKYTYDYWNCIPALLYPRNVNLISKPKIVDSDLEAAIAVHISKHGNEPFLLVQSQAVAMSALLTETAAKNIHIVICDTSTKKMFPGWPLRNLLAAVAHTRRDWKSAKFVCYRTGPVPSVIFEIGWDNQTKKVKSHAVGWERNVDGNLQPSFIDLSGCFDPTKLMEHSVQLNLRLIRWRLVPDINLDRFFELKCLILGAGTLGCNVARAMLAWGVRNFTFIDNACVSYSNIVRQSLFEFRDAATGTSPKAVAAADALRKIYPLVNAAGICMEIPMPGHSVSPSDHTVASDVKMLEELIISHDVVFLVLDSREARWLPTLLASVHRKLAISVAIGFDSFVIIRHGVLTGDEEPSMKSFSSKDLECIPGSQLGCYFCSDVTAPGNSLSDRTMDQQCTVSRAGISFTASGLAVELLAALLQHPLIGQSPALSDKNDDSTTPLGATPHQIRVFMSKFSQMTPSVRRFERCVACGPGVRSSYKTGGNQFLLKVFNNAKVLEAVSGLDQLQASATEIDMWEFDDNESISSLS